MKRLLCLLLLLSLAVWSAGCGKQTESTAQPTESTATTVAPTTAPVNTSAEASTEAPTEAPAEPETLLSWGGKTLSGYGAKWAGQQDFMTLDVKAADEEDADCASYSFSFPDSAEKHPGRTLSGSLVLGKDASVLFDIPEEAEFNPLAEGFLAEQVKALLPEAKEEMLTVGKTVWTVRTFCQNEAADGFVVYDLIAWSEEGGVLVYVNAAAVLRGAGIGDDAEPTLTDLMKAWFSSLEIR